MPLQLSKGGDLDAVQALLDRKVPDLLPLSLDPQGKINAETSGTDMSNPFILPIICWHSVYFHYSTEIKFS